MNKKTGLILFLSLVGIAVTVWTVNYFTKSEGGEKSGDASNFDELQKNTSKQANNDIVTILFNGQLNTVQFYANNRFVVFDNNNKQILKGTYTNGGKTLQADNSYGGKNVSSNSVYTNLITIIN